MKINEINENNKENQEYWDSVASTYTEHKSNISIMATLSSLIILEKRKDILEVGCGASEGTKFLTTQAKEGTTIYAVDISSEMLKQAKIVFENYTPFYSDKNNSYEFIDMKNQKEKIKIQANTKGIKVKNLQSDCENLPFEDEQFDAYISCLCLNSTYNYNNALKEMYRVLRNKGVFTFAVWGKREEMTWMVLNEILIKYGLKIFNDYYFRLGQDPQKTMKLLEEIGFKNVRHEYTNSFRKNDKNENTVYQAYYANYKKKIEEMKIKDPEKEKELDKEVRDKLHQFFTVEKRIPSMSVVVFYGEK